MTMIKTILYRRCHQHRALVQSFTKGIASTSIRTTTSSNTTSLTNNNHDHFDHPQKTQPISEHHLSHESTQDDIAQSLKYSYDNQLPTVLHQPNINADALYLWNNLNYLRVAVGEDVVVDVEIGGTNYNNAERVQITFGEYLNYINLFQQKLGDNDEQQVIPKQEEKEEEPLIYLAQNELFPNLKSDITIPSLCSDPSFNVGHGRLYQTMVWFGPKGCVSPLHYDPMDNLLMQFVGRKRILLYPPYPSSSSEMNWHYAGYNDTQYNTSPVDIEKTVDYSTYPNFRNAPIPYECMLYPGDILFIPSQWWHHVRSLDTSISVNVWWR